MSNHDDFVDDYIEYRIFEESMKKSGIGKPPQRNNGGGCCTRAILIVIVIAVLLLLGSCTVSAAKSYYHPEDLSYDCPNDFWDYEDAEDY